MNLLITGAWRHTAEQRQMLIDMGHRVWLLQNEQDALPLPYDEVEGVICNGLFLHHPIEKFSALRYIQLTSAGFDRVPMDYVRQKGIVIHNARGVYSTPMAEFALCGVLQIYKQSRFFADKQYEHRWEKHRGLMELAGKTVCIVGCGDVGVQCAKRFAAFDCRVVGVNIRPKSSPYFEKIVLLEQFNDVLPGADIVILAVPLAKETEHLMGDSRFALMKKGAVLVNIARGAVVNTDSLIHALEEKLGGAVLDVFEEEPLPSDSPLWETDNVILTPHNSFVGDGNSQRLWQIVANNLKMS